MKRQSTSIGIVIGLAMALAVLLPRPSDAGCGCEKPPPPPAQVRPNFASPGSVITILDPSLEDGKTYKVEIGWRDVSVQATTRRDLADGVAKVQLRVTVPNVSMGPTSIKVERYGRTVVRIPSSDFTVLQAPINLAQKDADVLLTCYRAAIGADGTMYIPLNIGSISHRMLFSGLAQGYPLMFGPQDMVIYNTQGYVMQLLGPEDTGLISIVDLGSPDSFEASYDRHEFDTYRAEHLHQGSLALSSDPAWHADGTPHIDHDNLIVAIQGVLESGSTPAPGKTAPFDFSVVTSLVDDPGAVSMKQIKWSSECTQSGWWNNDDD